MVTFTLTTPVNVGGLSTPSLISSLQFTGINITTTPKLAPIGTGVLSVVLTDPQSGAQETFSYKDASVLALWAQAMSPAAGTALSDIVATAVFNKLIADGKLPQGTLTSN